MGKLLLRILSRLRLLRYFNITISHSRNENKVIVPVIGTLGHDNLSLSELWMCDVLAKLLKVKSGLFIDVGVNLGQTLIKLKLVDKNAGYIGFDPNPVCIFYTKELVKANGFLNCQLVPVGISDGNELVTLFFYTDGDSDTSASIVKDFRPEKVYRKEYVACFAYTHLQPIINGKSLSIIKIDVEGAELQVLKCFANLIEDQRPFVLVEILPVYSAQNIDRLKRQQEIQLMAASLDYKILRINKRSDDFGGFQLLDTIGISDKIEDSDYLLCPSETLPRILDVSNR